MTIAAALIIASHAHACDCDGCASTAALSCSPMRLSVCPLGDFEEIAHACGGTGASIWVRIWTNGCTLGPGPIPGVPPTDFWIDACDPAEELYLCTGAILADSMTGMNGETTFSGVVRAGGCVRAGGIWIACQGQVILESPLCIEPLCLDVVIKSPDLTGAGGMPDGVVNLSDLVPFGTSYNTSFGQPGFSTCCDYNDDDKCNLSDFAYFGAHYQHSCI